MDNRPDSRKTPAGVTFSLTSSGALAAPGRGSALSARRKTGALPGKPFLYQRREFRRVRHLKHRAEGYNPDQQLGLVVLVIAEPELIVLIVQPLGLLGKMGEVEQHPLQGVPLVVKQQGPAPCRLPGCPAE